HSISHRLVSMFDLPSWRNGNGGRPEIRPAPGGRWEGRVPGGLGGTRARASHQDYSERWPLPRRMATPKCLYGLPWKRPFLMGFSPKYFTAIRSPTWGFAS